MVSIVSLYNIKFSNIPFNHVFISRLIKLYFQY
jgi:hypothetical protein